MSVDKLLKEMIRDEVQRAVAPLVEAVEELRQAADLASKLSSLLGTRGPGRPRAAAKAGKRGRKAGNGRRGPRGDTRACALKGCGKPARSKGYCSAHYQKYRMLDRTGRLPSDWKEHAAPGTVEDLKLPRGRAGAKALAEARAKAKK